MLTPANKITWDNTVYEFKNAKHNIMVYVAEGQYHYDDWRDDAEILIVEFRPDKRENDAYYVLHQITVNEYNPYVPRINDISNYPNRLAKVLL